MFSSKHKAHTVIWLVAKPPGYQVHSCSLVALIITQILVHVISNFASEASCVNVGASAWQMGLLPVLDRGS